MRSDCRLCAKLVAVNEKKNFLFVHEFRSSILLVGDHQYFPGYCLLVSKRHEREIHSLPAEERRNLFEELMIAGEAIADAFTPLKLNYASLGNVDEHIHWHIMPRYESDPDHTEDPFKNSSAFSGKATSEADAESVIAKLKFNIEKAYRERLQ